MEQVISIQVEELEEGGYLATSEDLPELLAQGRTVAETLEIAQDVARKLLESYLAHGDPLPDALALPVDPHAPLRLTIAVPVTG